MCNLLSCNPFISFLITKFYGWCTLGEWPIQYGLWRVAIELILEVLYIPFKLYVFIQCMHLL